MTRKTKKVSKRYLEMIKDPKTVWGKINNLKHFGKD